MSIASLLSALAQQRVLLANVEGKLKFRAPKNALEDALKSQVVDSKNHLLALLAPYEGFYQLAPLSKNQESLFFAHQLEPKSSAYNLAISLKLSGDINAQRLEQALNKLLSAQPQLHACYSHLSDGATSVACQLLAEKRLIQLNIVDAFSWSSEQLQLQVQKYYDHPISLSEGAGLSAQLYQRVGQGCVLVIKCHHIAADGWSLKLMASALSQAYLDETCVIGTDLEYLDYSLYQQATILSGGYQSSVDFWLKSLQPAPPPLRLGTQAESQRRSVRTNQGKTRFFNFSDSQYQSFNAASKKLQVSNAAFLLAAFQTLLMKNGKQRDIVIGVPSLGERAKGYSKCVGYFVNPVPLRCQRFENSSVKDHVRATHLELNQAIEHSDASFAQVAANVGGKRDPSRTPVFQSMFNFLPRTVLGDVCDWLYPWQAGVSNKFAGLDATPFVIEQQQGQFDLTLEIVDRGSEWLGIFKYDDTLFAEHEVNYWINQYQDILKSFTAAPDSSLFSEGETQSFIQVVVNATFTAEPIEKSISYFMHAIGINSRISFGPYNQIFQALVDPSSHLRKNDNGANVILVRLDDLQDSGSDAQAYGDVVEELALLIETNAAQLHAPLIIHLCKSSPHLCQLLGSTEAVIRKSFEARMSSLSNVVCLTGDQFERHFPLADYYEPQGEALGNIPFTLPYYAALGAMCSRKIYNLISLPVKALAIDCDGTLWDGVVGEVGPEAVVIGEDQKLFQQYLVAKLNEGVALCLCSKNEEADVWQVFEQRKDDMQLKRDHISFWRINWQPKSANIQSIAQEMNISTNAIAFLDDSLVEREEVAQHAPDVLCVAFPSEWSERKQFLENFWPLDARKKTEADDKRIAHYQNEQVRSQLKKQLGWGDFIRSLNLDVKIFIAQPSDIARLSQLSLRTNQFNTALIRLDEAGVNRYSNETDAHVWTVNVKDKFGDYGLVGAMYARGVGAIFCVDNFMLSCRALGRTVEYHMVRRLGEFAKTNGFTNVQMNFIQGDRNQPALEFIQSIAAISGSATLQQDYLLLSANELSQLEAPEPKAQVDQKTQKKNSYAVTTWSDGFNEIAQELQSLNSVMARLHPSMPRRHSEILQDEVESQVTEIWQSFLNTAVSSIEANFFELGGNSLLLAQVAIAMNQKGLKVALVDLFQYPSVSSICEFIRNRQQEKNSHLLDQVFLAPRLSAPYIRLRQFRGIENNG